MDVTPYRCRRGHIDRVHINQATGARTCAECRRESYARSKAIRKGQLDALGKPPRPDTEALARLSKAIRAGGEPECSGRDEFISGDSEQYQRVAELCHRCRYQTECAALAPAMTSGLWGGISADRWPALNKWDYREETDAA